MSFKLYDMCMIDDRRGAMVSYHNITLNTTLAMITTQGNAKSTSQINNYTLKKLTVYLNIPSITE